MKKGFLFIEVLVGLFILGLVAVTCLPILNLSLNNFTRIKDKSEMHYIGEMVLEKFKSKDDYIVDLMAQLETVDAVDYSDNSFDSDKYSCQLVRLKSTHKLLEFKVIVNKQDQENNSYVEYKASIPKV